MKIIALLLNPSIDQIYEIENFEVGETFKVNDFIVYPVGKAISFSLSIRELNKEKEIIKVIAFIGKEEISLYSNFLSEKNINFKFIEISGRTRSNKTINDPIKCTTTHIREKGFNIEKRDLENLINLLKEQVNENDFCVFSGSIPPNVNTNIYYKLITLCKKKGAICVLDTSGEALIEGLKANPKIIKPNLVELSQILEKPELNELNFSNITETVATVVKKSKILLNNELEIILITLENKGAICLTKDEVLYGNVQVKDIVDTVGSGDSFLAGFLLNYFLKKDMYICFKYALACGAANTLIPGPGIFNNEDVKKIIEKVEIIELE